MKAIDILNHFLSLASWVDEKNTVDRIIIGDPEKDVKKALVTWMSTMQAVRHAADNGFDMIMTHEPTFWIHSHEQETMYGWEPDHEKRDAAFEKKKLIDENGLVVMRNHDVWDRMPDIGIPWALAGFLGFGGRPCAFGSDGYQHRYDMEPVSLGMFAERIAARTAMIGEAQIQVFGDMSKTVSRIGVGTGCCCKLGVFKSMGCDAAIVCDDGIWYWEDITWALDAGYPLIRINHGTSEEPGMIRLAEYMNKNFQGVKTEYLPHNPGIRIVGNPL